MKFEKGWREEEKEDSNLFVVHWEKTPGILQ